MSKGSNRFQQRAPVGRVFKDGAFSKGSVSRPREFRQRFTDNFCIAVMTKIQEGTRRVGIEFFCRSRLADPEIVAALVWLSDLGALSDEEATLAKSLDASWDQNPELTELSNELRGAAIMMIGNGIYQLKLRPIKHPIVGWSYQ